MKNTMWPVCPKTEPLMTSMIKLSRFYGTHPEYVLAGGGNLSIKSPAHLWVKASGFPLATIGEEGFVELERKTLASTLKIDIKKDPGKRESRFTEVIMSSCTQPEKGLRPSVESVLHHLLPAIFVVHIHPTAVNMLTCTNGGEKSCRKWFGSEALWMPICEPGLILANKINKALSAYTRRTGRKYPALILLENHGLIICGNTPREIRENTEYVIKTVTRRIGKIPAAPFGPCRPRPALKRLAGTVRKCIAVCTGKDGNEAYTFFDNSKVVMQLVNGAQGRKAALGGPLTPDQIVYCSSFPLWIRLPDDCRKTDICGFIKKAVDGFRKEFKYTPIVILVEGIGMITAGEQAKQAETARQLYIDSIKVMAGALQVNGIQPMADKYRKFIETWEVEAYRRKIAKKG